MIVKEKEIIETLSAEDLPAAWSFDTIGSLIAKDGVFVDGDWVESKDQDPKGDVRLIQLADIGDGFYRNRSDRYLTYNKALKLGCTFLQNGDVLVARMPDPLGRACIFPGDSKKSVTVVDVCIIRPNRSDVNNRWLMYFVNAPTFRAAVASLQAGSTRKRISRSNLAKIQLPVPPPKVQNLIVAEIEKQFSRLDEAVANLKRVKANLKRYKAAVLKAAVEGRLVETEAELARREGRNYESGEKLLKRMLETRRALWKGKGKYKEPAAPDKTDLAELPMGWAYATAEQLTDENRAITYGVIKLGKPVDGGISVLRSSDVRHLRIDLSNVKNISPEIAANYRRTFLTGGEVVMTVRGTLGGIAVVPSQCRGFNVSREVAMLVLLEPLMAHLIAIFIASAPLENWLMGRTKGIAYRGINIETLKALPIPVPPLAEQPRIVAEIDRRLSLVREVETQIDANLQRAERMRQSILNNAFIGTLSV